MKSKYKTLLLFGFALILLLSGQAVSAKARLCLESENQKRLVAGSANSNKVEIQLE